MLDKSFLKQNLLTKLTTKSLRLIPQLEMSTDIDGRILADVYDLRQTKVITPRLLSSALKECEKFGFISKNDDGTYFNNFHYSNKDFEKGFNYINVYDFFNDEDFKSLYKRSLNFFYYILTSKLPGKFHTVAAELLYQNTLNQDELAIDYFQDFNDFANHLSSLVSFGYLEVQLGNTFFSNPSGKSKQDYAVSVKNALYKYCGKDSGNMKKSRIKNKRDRHLLKIRVTESLINAEKKSVYDRRITLKDLEIVALQYGYDLNDFDIELLKSIHMVKKDLHNKFGRAGIEMYRNAIAQYFHGQSHRFEADILNKDFSDILKKQYVMPLIKLTLHSYFKNVTPGMLEDSSVLSSIEKSTQNLASYLTTEAYYDDLVLIENDAKKINSELYDHLITSNKKWYDFDNKLKSIYRTEEIIGNSRLDVLKLALDGKLTSKLRREEDYIQKNSIHRKNLPKREAPIYNWLET
jgi:hypothetical protein